MSRSKPHRVGKFAEFDLDQGNQCVILQENHERSSGFRIYHYLWEPLTAEERADILKEQAKDEIPEHPIFSGLDPQVGQRYLCLMGGRIAYGPFENWQAVAAQLESQGYEVSYSDKWVAP